MARVFIYLFGLIASILAACFIGVSNAWFTVPAGFAVGFLIPLVDALITNAKWLKLIVYSVRTWRGRVRVSISYLYRIRVDNDYMLIRGARFPQFQPVGGVYKFHPSSQGLRLQLDIRDDELLVPDQISDHDLRVRVPGKHLLAFVKWFEKGIGRETDGWREFYEELIAPGILPEELFRVVRYDRIGRHWEPMRLSGWAGSQEILIADILELLPSSEQLEALRQLKVDSHPKILWATEPQIRRHGALEGSSSQNTTISRTATWALKSGE